jgi:hypothetical protein
MDGINGITVLYAPNLLQKAFTTNKCQPSLARNYVYVVLHQAFVNVWKSKTFAGDVGSMAWLSWDTL